MYKSDKVTITCDKCEEKHTLHLDNVIRLTRTDMLREIINLPKFAPGGDNPYIYIALDDILAANEDLQ